MGPAVLGAPLLGVLLLLSGCTRERSRATVAVAAAPDLRAAVASAADQVRRCYRQPRVPTAGRRISTRLLVRYAPDGSLIGMPLLVAQEGLTRENRAYATRMAEAARLAVIRCSPVRLPAEVFRTGSSRLYLTFSPSVRA